MERLRCRGASKPWRRGGDKNILCALPLCNSVICWEVVCLSPFCFTNAYNLSLCHNSVHWLTSNFSFSFCQNWFLLISCFCFALFSDSDHGTVVFHTDFLPFFLSDLTKCWEPKVHAWLVGWILWFSVIHIVLAGVIQHHNSYSFHGLLCLKCCLTCTNASH